MQNTNGKRIRRICSTAELQWPRLSFTKLEFKKHNNNRTKRPSHPQLVLADVKYSGDMELDGERDEDAWCRVHLKLRVLGPTHSCVLL